MESSILPWTFISTKSEPETKHSVQEAQVCSKNECCIWLCAQESEIWELPLCLCTQRQHFDEWSKLEPIEEVFDKRKIVLSNTDVIEACTLERPNTNWKLYKLAKFTVFAALLRNVSMGCKDSILAEPLTENHNLDWQTYESITINPYNHNLCLLRALNSQLHRNEGFEEETSKLFDLFMEKIEGTNPSSFQGVFMKNFLLLEDLAQGFVFLYDIDFVNGTMIGEFASRSVGKPFNKDWL